MVRKRGGRKRAIGTRAPLSGQDDTLTAVHGVATDIEEARGVGDLKGIPR